MSDPALEVLAARGRRPTQGEPLLDRAFRILTAFGPDHRSLSLTALSLRAGLPKASALRITRKLVEWGALERAENGEYVVGLRLLEVASLAPRGHGLRATALPYLEDLHHSTGQHVLLAVREGREAILVERLSARLARPGAVPGRRSDAAALDRRWPSAAGLRPAADPGRSAGRRSDSAAGECLAIGSASCASSSPRFGGRVSPSRPGNGRSR